jgi:polyisoprenyl-phosphate glycosyltransferase
MPDLSDYINSLRGPIMVTGASGFIGANLFKTLLKYRADVFGIEQRRKSWRIADVKDDFVITVDLNDQAATKNLVDNIRPQTVFSCVAYGAYSFEGKTDLIYQTNFQSTVNLVGMLSARTFSAFVHAGTSSEYGANCSGPLESAPGKPNSHYAVSKAATSEYLRYMGKYNKFPCLGLRLYSVYGTLEDTSRLIPNLVRRALAGGFPPFVHPDISRDFVYVDDVCAAFVMAAAQMNPGLYGESFNIGSGVKTTIRDLALTAKDVFHLEGESDFGTMPERAWDLSEWYANVDKAAAHLNWRPSVGLEEGLRKTADWVALLSDDDFMLTANKAMTKRRRSVSAIIACYKDAEAIPLMYRRLSETFRKIGVDYEIIFVNDCSPDESAQVIRDISYGDARVIGISHSRNFGSQMAFRSGMELSTKDGVVLLDGDLQDPPELIEEFYSQWEAGFDVVFGRRVKRDMPFFWSMFHKLFYRIFAAFSYVPIPLDAGDFSLMDRRVVGWLLNCPERDLFVRGLRAYVGFKQTGVDYIRPERAFGKSTNNLLKNIDWAKKGIFSFSNTPLTMLTTTGVLCLFFSMLIAAVAAGLRIFDPNIVPRGVTTVLLVILFFGSLNLFAVGLVGEYVAKIMAEVKGRPRLIRSALIRGGEQTELLPEGRTRFD